MTSEELGFKSRAIYLADHAVVESGKLYVHGAYVSRLNLPAFPSGYPMSVVAAVEVPWRAYQEDHTLTIQLLDADGGQLPLTIEGSFRVGADPSMHRGDPTVMPFAAMVPLPLERPGDYALALLVDGIEPDRWPFRAQLSITMASPPAAGPRPDDGPGGS